MAKQELYQRNPEGLMISQVIQRNLHPQTDSSKDYNASSDDNQKPHVDLPNGNIIFLQNQGQVRILNSIIDAGENGISVNDLRKSYLNSIIDAGENGISVNDLRKSYLDEGLSPASANTRVRNDFAFIRSNLKGNSYIVNLVPNSRSKKNQLFMHIKKLR